MVKEEIDFNLKNIVENRKLPGLLIFDRESGDIIFRNSNIACNILDEKEYRDWILEQFNCAAMSPENPLAGEKPPDESVVRTVMCPDENYYSIRAFALAIESQGKERAVVAVLIEKISEEISTERLNLHRLCSSYHFSPRETEVLERLQLGRTDKMIAKEMQISPETVHGYVKSIRGKLGVSTRTAIMHKLISI